MGVEGRDVKGVSIPTPVNVQQKNARLGPRFSFHIVSHRFGTTAWTQGY